MHGSKFFEKPCMYLLSILDTRAKMSSASTSRTLPLSEVSLISKDTQPSTSNNSSPSLFNNSSPSSFNNSSPSAFNNSSPSAFNNSSLSEFNNSSLSAFDSSSPSTFNSSSPSICNNKIVASGNYLLFVIICFWKYEDTFLGLTCFDFNSLVIFIENRCHPGGLLIK